MNILKLFHICKHYKLIYKRYRYVFLIKEIIFPKFTNMASMTMEMKVSQKNVKFTA